jgi:hypothetical protein
MAHEDAAREVIRRMRGLAEGIWWGKVGVALLGGLALVAYLMSGGHAPVGPEHHFDEVVDGRHVVQRGGDLALLVVLPIGLLFGGLVLVGGTYLNRALQSLLYPVFLRRAERKHGVSRADIEGWSGGAVMDAWWECR